VHRNDLEYSSRSGDLVKKKALHASEQDRPDVQAQRQAWHRQLQGIDASCLVFLDESGAATNMTRRRGRCAIGQRLVASVPHGHWQTTTILSAIRLSGPFAPAVFNCPTDREVFRSYVEQVLIPELRPGDVVIMDNLSPHKAAGIEEAIASVGAMALYLPPYSPDFNPIEHLWSKVKEHLRKLAARTFDSLCDGIGDALSLVTASDCHAFFQNCGYAT
jgi:transposase